MELAPGHIHIVHSYLDSILLVKIHKKEIVCNKFSN